MEAYLEGKSGWPEVQWYEGIEPETPGCRPLGALLLTKYHK